MFPLWDFEIKILLRAREVMDIVDGTDLLMEKGRDGEKIRKWKTKDAKAQLYIFNR
jgi:hypothetical protein